MVLLEAASTTSVLTGGVVLVASWAAFGVAHWPLSGSLGRITTDRAAG